MNYCGSFTVFGHGDNAICGKPYIDGLYQCPHCKLKDLQPAMFSPEYKSLQEQFHRDCPDYGVSGSRYADQIIQLAKNLGSKEILDYGCGKCTLQKAIPFPIQNYDPFIPEHSARPSPSDIVVCTDVMEHVELEHVSAVLRDIVSLTKKLVFFQIATRPAKKVLPDGRNAHLIQQNSDWWLDQLLKHFHISAFQDMNGGFICICMHKVTE